jgi:hypothetical protein
MAVGSLNSAKNESDFAVTDLRVAADIFSGLPGEEEVFLEKNPFGNDTVYIRVKPPHAPDAAAKTVILTQPIPGLLTGLSVDYLYDPESEEKDDKLDVIYTFRGLTDLPTVQSFKVYHDHRDIAVRVSTALGVSLSELYAPTLSQDCLGSKADLSQQQGVPECCDDQTPALPALRGGSVDTRVDNLERNLQSVKLEQTRFKFDLDRMERLDRQRDFDIADLTKKIADLTTRLEALEKNTPTLSADDVATLRRDLEDLKSNVEDLESRLDEVENRTR